MNRICIDSAQAPWHISTIDSFCDLTQTEWCQIIYSLLFGTSYLIPFWLLDNVRGYVCLCVSAVLVNCINHTLQACAHLGGSLQIPTYESLCIHRILSIWALNIYKWGWHILYNFTPSAEMTKERYHYVHNRDMSRCRLKKVTLILTPILLLWHLDSELDTPLILLAWNKMCSNSG